MFHKVLMVKALPEYRLIVRFAEGVTKEYDCKPLFNEIDAFKKFLDSPEEFTDVKVDVGGYGIVWDDETDLSCDEIYDNGKIIKTKFDGLISFSEATKIWKLNESTLRKAVTYGKLREGIDAYQFGKQWIVTIDAMEREYNKE